MTQAEISGISPFFIVSHAPSSLSFYRDQLGFEITFQGPDPDDIFLGIVRRGGAQILLKDIGVAPVPNYTRDVKKGIARWDAFVSVTDPDALAAEFASRNVEFFEPLKDTDDGLRGFELKDADGYLFFRSSSVIRVSRNRTHERFLRREITPNNALQPPCEDARGCAGVGRLAAAGGQDKDH